MRGEAGIVFSKPMPLLLLVMVWFGSVGWAETAFMVFCMF